MSVNSKSNAPEGALDYVRDNELHQAARRICSSPGASRYPDRNEKDPVKLVEGIVRLVWGLCRGYGRDLDSDDAFASSLYRVVKEINTYDPDKGRITTWARWKVLGELSRMRDYKNRWRRLAVRSLDTAPADNHEEVEDPSGGSYYNAVPVTDSPDYEGIRIDVEALGEAFTRLTGDQAEMMERRYGLNGREPETARSIGDSLGITPQAVTWRVNVCIRILRGILGAGEGYR